MDSLEFGLKQRKKVSRNNHPVPFMTDRSLTSKTRLDSKPHKISLITSTISATSPLTIRTEKKNKLKKGLNLHTINHDQTITQSKANRSHRNIKEISLICSPRRTTPSRNTISKNYSVGKFRTISQIGSKTKPQIKPQHSQAKPQLTNQNQQNFMNYIVSLFQKKDQLTYTIKSYSKKKKMILGSPEFQKENNYRKQAKKIHKETDRYNNIINLYKAHCHELREEILKLREEIQEKKINNLNN